MSSSLRVSEEKEPENDAPIAIQALLCPPHYVCEEDTEMRAPEQPKDSHPKTLTKALKSNRFEGFSGLLPPSSPEWAREET